MEKTSRKVFANISWNLAGSVLRLLISFVVSILTAKYLGPSNYGMLGYVASVSAFFTSICNLGINAILVKEIIEDPDHEGTTLGSTLFLQSISTLICSAVFCSTIALLNPGEPTYLMLAGIQSIYMLSNVAHTLTYWFQSKLENKITTIASTVGYIAVAVYRIFLLAAQKNILWFAWATTLDMVVVGMILIQCYRKKNGPPLSVSIEKCKSILSRSRHFILAGLMVSLYAQMDKVMLKSLIDSASVGFYTTANGLNNMWTFVIAAIIDSSSPVIYKAYDQGKERFERYLKILYAVVVWICVVVGIGFGLLSDWIVNLLYGIAYAPAAPILRILVWSAMFSYLGVIKNIWIIKERKNKYLVAFTAIGALLNATLNFVLIPRYGAIGAAFATIAAQCVSSVLAQMLFKETRHGCTIMFEAVMLRGVFAKGQLKTLVTAALREIRDKKKHST